MSGIENFNPGDIIQLHGPHPTLPKELEEKYWRVTGYKDGNVQLEGPFTDKDGTIKYKSKSRNRK